MKSYLVGGAVRDSLLDLPVHERDWVVVGATPGELRRLGFTPADADESFPVYLHPESGDEYALARRETKRGPGYRGFAVDASPGVTLEEDLARRDLTINAIAREPSGRLVDPFNGLDDLRDGILRHVTPAFVEDPVRLLRLARFAARFGQWGFRVAHDTQRLCREMVEAGELATVTPERLWQEMRKALLAPQPWRFFEVLHATGALQVLLPGLASAVGGHRAHAGTPGTFERVLAPVCDRYEDVPTRYAAALLPAAGQADTLIEASRPDRKSADMLRACARAMPAFGTLALHDPAALSGFVREHSGLRDVARFDRLLLLCELGSGRTGTAAILADARDAMQGISARDVQAEGYAGAAMGDELARRQVAAVAARLGS